MLGLGIALNSIWLENRFPMRQLAAWLKTKALVRAQTVVSSYSQGHEKSFKGNGGLMRLAIGRPIKIETKTTIAA